MIITDFLIIGGGIIGLSVARELRRRHPTKSITVIDKESRLGEHASGRNSGVIHAGFYYTSDSLKARFCCEGSIALKNYIKKRKLSINECGKIVVAQSELDLVQLNELKKRGDQNGVELYIISSAEARKIEPKIKTCGQALWSPNTATADPHEIMIAMQKDVEDDGIKILFNSCYQGNKNGIILAGGHKISTGYTINCSGLYADKVAIDFGFSQHYRVLPFKGLYLYSDEIRYSLKTNVYPVPNLKNPFLGVHFTVTSHGKVKIGPTAIPALWREQYGGTSGFNMSEFFEIAWRDIGLIARSDFDFRRLALEELLKYSKRHLVSLAGQLVSDIEVGKFVKWGNPGIRAQLIDTRTGKLEMDFVVQGDKKSIHVLNAVSPAWTCAMPFAEYVCNIIESKV